MGDLERAVEAHQAGDLATAERLYRGILAQQDSHDAYGNLGVVLAARGAFAEAEAAYRRAIALRPRPTTHRRNLALLYLRTRRLPEAVTVLEEVLRDDPRDDRARLSLGNAYLALGRDDGWHFYASRPERLTAAARRLSFPEWLGEPLAEKRLFIMGEQAWAIRSSPPASCAAWPRTRSPSPPRRRSSACSPSFPSRSSAAKGS